MVDDVERGPANKRTVESRREVLLVQEHTCLREEACPVEPLDVEREGGKVVCCQLAEPDSCFLLSADEGLEMDEYTAKHRAGGIRGHQALDLRLDLLEGSAELAQCVALEREDRKRHLRLCAGPEREELGNELLGFREPAGSQREHRLRCPGLEELL